MDAPHPKAREAHLAMAESYEGRLRAIAAERRRSGIQLVSAA